MNKYAAEKIAQEYYALGAQLALTKQANFAKGFNKAQNALLATLGGKITAGLSAPQIKELLSKSEMLSDSFARGDLAQRVGTALSGPKAMLDTNSVFPSAIQKALKQATQHAEEAATLSTADQIINALPEALGIGAGLGVGAGIYKGLGKLDKKLKLY